MFRPNKSFHICWLGLVTLLFVVVPQPTSATQSTYYLWTGQAAAQTQIDLNHRTSWHISVRSGSVVFGGGNFTMKRGSQSFEDVTLSLYRGADTSGTLLGRKTVTVSGFTQSFASIPFHFASTVTLTPGSYYAVVASNAADSQNFAYFIKGTSDALISLDGTVAGQIDPAIAGASAQPDAANLTLNKTATGTVLTGGTITYTLGLGNSGGSPSGTSATVKDVLPAGVVATAVTAGTGVTAVDCGSLPSAAGATLTCSVTLSSALDSTAPNGTAAFTVTATAPSSAGTITNYASVDPTGGSSPATPGVSCTTLSCASAATTVNTPSNLTLSKTATATVLTGGTITYTLGLGNSGGTTSGTSATVKDVLPTGVVATAVAAGTGVTSVDCGSLPSAAGATLTCSVTLSAGLAASAATGTAAFTVTATAPSSAGAITNYAAVDPTGSNSPATPGTGCTTTSCASAATTVNTPSNLTLSKTAPARVNPSGTISYTLGLGNSGGTTSGTSATVKDVLPTGVVATAVAAGTGVTSVDCGSLPSAAGATLTCTVTLTSGLAASAANGTAAFTVTATAPSSAGAITNYAAVDPTGSNSPATPGAGCSTTSCASAATSVEVLPNLTLSKTATGTVLTGGTITYTLGLGNSGGTTSGTSATVKDVLPTGVVATAVAAGTGVTSVDCGSLPSAAGATLTCTVTLTSGLAASAATGTAAFTVTATAPSAAGAITNYAAVDPTGGNSPATPGTGCTTTSCASAATTVGLPGDPGIDFLIRKRVSRPVLMVGDTVEFTLVIKNCSPVSLRDVVLTDTQARGFVPLANSTFLQRGTTNIPQCPNRLEMGAAASSSTDGLSLPMVTRGGTAEFGLGEMAPGIEYTVTYTALVDFNAPPGTQLTAVTGTFRASANSLVVSRPVEVDVTVVGAEYAPSNLILGRVFDDLNRNDLFDRGETGLAGVRVVLSTGQATVTDRDGLYSFPSVASGANTVAIDPDTVPEGYGPPPTSNPRQQGWSRLLRSPLGSGILMRQNFALVAQTPSMTSLPLPASKPSVSTLIRDGGYSMANGVVPPGAADVGRLEIIADRADLAAGGRDRTLVTIRAFDPAGLPIPAGLVTLSTTAGEWIGPVTADDDVDGATSRLAVEAYCRQESRGVSLPLDVNTVSLPVRDGVAVACLQSGLAPAVAVLTVSQGGKAGAVAQTHVRSVATRAAPVVAAIGELSFVLGSEAASGAASSSLRQHAAFFLQTPSTGDAQLTLAATTGDSINQATGVDRRFANAATDHTYPVLGDTSTYQELAMSNARVYARLDFGRSRILFGDLHGDATRQDRSGLISISRSLTGAEVHLERRPGQWLAVQAARPDTAYSREVFPGPVTGVVRLSHGRVLSGSEVLTVEVRDRRQPDLILEQIRLARGVDYVLDAMAGAVYFSRPLPLFDRTLSAEFLVVSYEHATAGLDNSIVVFRGEQAWASGLRVRATGLTEAASGTGRAWLGGVELEQRLAGRGRLRLEIPFSRNMRAGDVSDEATGMAVRVELDQPFSDRPGNAFRLRFSKTDTVFVNPYGTPVVPGLTSAIADVELAPSSRTRLRLLAQGETAHSSHANARRATISAELARHVGRAVELTARVDARHLDDTLAQRTVDSRLVTAGLDWRPARRFEAGIRREQNMGDADPTYPDQTMLSARYRVRSGAQLFVSQRWSDHPIIPMGGVEAAGLFSPLSTRETAIGFESRLHRLTTFTSRYQLDRGFNATQGAALLGVMTRLPVTRTWAFDVGLQRAVQIQGEGRGFTSAIGGIAFTPEQWRTTVHYQYRSGQREASLVSAAVAGQVTPSISVSGHYRRDRTTFNNVTETRDEALAALALRPKQSDRVGLLFAWNHGDALSPAMAVRQTPNNRIDRLSLDGYYQVTSRLEFHQRVGLLRTHVGRLGSTATLLSQSRLQYRLASRFDLAGELRLAKRFGTVDTGDMIGAAELAYWVSADLRAGIGYTTRPWTSFGPALITESDRGNVYVVLTSRLSSLFNLFQGRVTPAARVLELPASER